MTIIRTATEARLTFSGMALPSMNAYGIVMSGSFKNCMEAMKRNLMIIQNNNTIGYLGIIIIIIKRYNNYTKAYIERKSMILIFHVTTIMQNKFLSGVLTTLGLAWCW